MSLWAADDAKGTLIEPPNQLPITGIVGNCESVFSTFREDDFSRDLGRNLWENESDCRCGLRIGLNFEFDVVQHAIMNFMNQEITPQFPISLGCHFDFVPCASFKPCLTSRKSNEAELSLPRSEIAMQMRRGYVSV